MTLHEAIQQILIRENGSMRPVELADEINRTKLYTKGDGSPVKSSQIGARVKNYPYLFTKENGFIRLKSRTGIKKVPIMRKDSKVKAVQKLEPSLALKVLMNEKNFKSAADIDSRVPDEPGVYCIRLAKGAVLPETFQSKLEERNHNIIYIGIASKSLKKRFLGQELRSKGHGTFFRSIGAVLGFLPDCGSLKGKANQNNYKFNNQNTHEIIEWINENLLVNWIAADSELLKQEDNLIKMHLPLLNIQGNPLALDELRVLREKCKLVGRS
ncbi:hypothetical protein GYB57_15260 [bacterium]|nr:hypothetical protein [bacterium]